MTQAAASATTSRCAPAEAGAQQPARRRRDAALLAVVALAVLLLHVAPGAQAALELDRAAVAGGQWWRLVSGNLVHYGWGHLAADLAAFIVLCWVAPQRFRETALVAALAAVAVGVSAYVLAGGVATYRGLSGVNYALLAWACLSAAIRHRGWKAVLLLGVLFAVVAKTTIETATGRLLVNVCLPDGVWVVGWAHVAGLAVGIGAALICALSPHRSRSQRGAEPARPRPPTANLRRPAPVGRRGAA